MASSIKLLRTPGNRRQEASGKELAVAQPLGSGDWLDDSGSISHLIEETWNAEFDAARALLALGVTGKAEIWRDGRVASTLDVERAAETTIVENASVGPVVGRWKAFVDDYVAPLAAVSDRPGTLEPASEDGRW